MTLDPNKFYESDLEIAYLDYFITENGYKYIHGSELDREYTEPLLIGELESYLHSRYANEHLTNTEIRRCIAQLQNISLGTSLKQANAETFWTIEEGFDLHREDPSKPPVHIDFYDYNNVESNKFLVSNQVVYKSKQGGKARFDVVLYINGIPRMLTELKTLSDDTVTIYDAYEQITQRYNRDVPDFMRYIHASVISDGVKTKLGTIFTPYEYYYSWPQNDPYNKNYAEGLDAMVTLITGAFSKENVIPLFADFVIYPDNVEQHSPIIARYNQFYGTQLTLESIENAMMPDGDGKGGTYEGSTGCGKTNIMKFVSHFLMKRKQDVYHNPTVLITVDRNDLEEQTGMTFMDCKRYLGENDVKMIETRQDLHDTLKNKGSGGIYIQTVQKYCEEVGLLSTRTNIIELNDEAHRTVLNADKNIVVKNGKLQEVAGYAYYDRQALPHATRVGLTASAVDATFDLFGPSIDVYTSDQSVKDGITVPLRYIQRKTMLKLDEKSAKQIQEYYNECKSAGTTVDQIVKSEMAMSRLSSLLCNPSRIDAVVNDTISIIEKIEDTISAVMPKSIYYASNRGHAFLVYKKMKELRPEWFVEKKSNDRAKLPDDDLEKRAEMPKVCLVATRGPNDEKELYDLCGSKTYRQTLAREFKDPNSNFTVAIAVDMWSTGFDALPLFAEFIDKPIQDHNALQTSSRPNRVFNGKEYGLIIDYIGIWEDLSNAYAKWGNGYQSAIISADDNYKEFKKELSTIENLFVDLDDTKFFDGTPRERAECINRFAQYVQTDKELEKRFIELSTKLKHDFNVCKPAGLLNDNQQKKATFYTTIMAYLNKLNTDEAPDMSIMNNDIQEMVNNAITCSGMEELLDINDNFDLMSEDFQEKLKKVEPPFNRYRVLKSLLARQIARYGKVNKLKQIEFDKKLRKIVNRYNKRGEIDKVVGAYNALLEELIGQLMDLSQELVDDETSFEKMGITYEEKSFYDIIVKVRNQYGFEYPDDDCIKLAQEIKIIVDKESAYADWGQREEILATVRKQILVLLRKAKFPKDCAEDIRDKVLDQALVIKNI